MVAVVASCTSAAAEGPTWVSPTPDPDSVDGYHVASPTVEGPCEVEDALGYHVAPTLNVRAETNDRYWSDAAGAPVCAGSPWSRPCFFEEVHAFPSGRRALLFLQPSTSDTSESPVFILVRATAIAGEQASGALTGGGEVPVARFGASDP